LIASGPVGFYAVIEKVVFEPDEKAPERMQLWGAFAVVDGGANAFARLAHRQIGQSDDRDRRRCVGFIPDRPFIYEKLTGAEFLRFVAGLYDQSGPKIEHRARELLALFDLEEWRDELVESYSHGMRQKLIISSALIHRPECIVVDEPMVGLDPKAARLLKDIFRQFVDRGGTVLMSTHTMEIAEVMCDRIAIVFRGKIAAYGTMAELRQQTSSEGMSLEDLFLKLTGGHHTQPLDTVLDA